jgi:lysozyme family protein
MAAQCFDAALAETLRHEGGYVDHPLDPGGATNLGITRATLAAWRGRPVAKAEVMALTVAEAGAIYRARYWNVVAGDRLPPGLDLAVFDFAVNSGPSRAIRTLQACLGVARTGRMDEATFAGLARHPPNALIRALTARRRGFLMRLATWSTFGRGWSRRVASVEARALAFAGPARPAPGQPSKPDRSQSPNKERAMTMSKSVFESRTVWTNIIGLAALALGAIGFDTGTIDANRLIEAASQAVAGVSFVLSTVFRVAATRTLSR